MGVPDTLLRPLVHFYDELARRERIERFERLILVLAAIGLLAHLGLIALARAAVLPPAVDRHIGVNFLAALYTPFSLVLFFEVVLLVLSLPYSLTGALAKQFEIVSLIVVRAVFKDIAKFEGLTTFEEHLRPFSEVMVDLAGSVVMFLLVAVFYHASNRRPKRGYTRDALPADPQLRRFIAYKKVLALGLLVLMFGLAAYNLGLWLLEARAVVVDGVEPVINVDTIFYKDLFTVMIFVDVLVLILSMVREDAYHLVFRNAGYVIAAILLRFSLSLHKPYDVALGLIAMVYAILIALISRYWLHLIREGKPRPVDADALTG